MTGRVLDGVLVVGVPGAVRVTADGVETAPPMAPGITSVLRPALADDRGREVWVDARIDRPHQHGTSPPRPDQQTERGAFG